MIKTLNGETTLQYIDIEEELLPDIGAIVTMAAEQMERNGYDSSVIEDTVRECIEDAKRRTWY